MTRFASATYQGRALEPHAPRARGGAMARRAVRTILLAVAMTMIALITPALEEAVVTAPIFAVRSIEVRGARQLGDEAVRRLAGVGVGMPLFAVDAEGAEHALAAQPRVAAADVQRTVWGHVLIQIDERESCALVIPGGRAGARGAQHPLEVDRGGVLMDPVDPMRWPDLPLVTGLVTAGARAGQVVPHARFEGIGALLGLLARPEIDLANRVSSIDVAGDSGWIMTMAGSGVSVRLPPRAVESRDLLALRTVLQDVERRGPAGGTIDMRYRGQLVWVPAADSTTDSTTAVAATLPPVHHPKQPALRAAAAPHRTRATHDKRPRNARGGRNAT